MVPSPLMASKGVRSRFPTMQVASQGMLMSFLFILVGVLANGTYPGPPILVQKGDNIRITMNNKLVNIFSH
jgi:hypothetical protein